MGERLPAGGGRFAVFVGRNGVLLRDYMEHRSSEVRACEQLSRCGRRSFKRPFCTLPHLPTFSSLSVSFALHASSTSKSNPPRFPTQLLILHLLSPTDKYKITAQTPVYTARAALAKKVKGFWANSINNCGQLAQFVDPVDETALSFLEDVWVEHDKEDPRNWEVRFVSCLCFWLHSGDWTGRRGRDRLLDIA